MNPKNATVVKTDFCRKLARLCKVVRGGKMHGFDSILEANVPEFLLSTIFIIN